MIIADWSSSAHWNSGRHLPCIHCHRPTLLLDDARRQAHNVCAQVALAALIDKQNQRRTTWPPVPPPTP
jgi:hypothetical protein